MVCLMTLFRRILGGNQIDTYVYLHVQRKPMLGKPSARSSLRNHVPLFGLRAKKAISIVTCQYSCISKTPPPHHQTNPELAYAFVPVLKTSFAESNDLETSMTYWLNHFDRIFCSCRRTLILSLCCPSKLNLNWLATKEQKVFILISLSLTQSLALTNEGGWACFWSTDVNHTVV